MNLTLEQIKENLQKVKMNNDTFALEVYMKMLVEKKYVNVGNKYLKIEDKKKLDQNTFEDIDENGIDTNTGFNYCMDEKQILENNERKKRWTEIMRSRVSLEDAYEKVIEEGV